MSFLTGRDGQISLVRVGTLVAIIGVLLVVVAAAAFYVDWTSRQVPLDIELYPGAQSMGSPEPRGTTRNLYFIVPDTAPEQVMEHYQRLLESQYGETGENCIRLPDATTNSPNPDNLPGIVPYEFVCLFDRSGFYATQYTKVRIQPGPSDSDPALSQEGNTLIEYEQRWEAS